MAAEIKTSPGGRTQGPRVVVTMRCDNCVYCEGESYAVQGDSGTTVYCTAGGERQYVGDTTWRTPAWCPLMPKLPEGLTYG